ncbi:S-adenosyl-L-methionine-dependent methyltransferase [Hymenopellis radicata]|nr:S-adenosyl-L-methionine-dependent methyltransferase [Hymenopellis radicata]
MPGPMDADMAVDMTKRIIVAAAAQLIATVRSPPETLQLDCTGTYTTAVLGVIEDANVADILMEAGPQGLHVKDIAAASGLDAAIIARFLRFLATRHIFKELSPDVFTNNRISMLLSKFKPTAAIKADPVGRFDAGPLAGFISHMADEAQSASPYIKPFVQDPKVDEAPFNMALKTKAKMWEWIEEPGNEWRARRFTAGMKAGAAMFSPDIFINGIDGKSLKEGSVVVDVGGSIGSCTLILEKAYPHLKYVVQDLPNQIDIAGPYWQENDADAVKSGRVSLQVHDFFKPNPVKDAAVYFMRVVIHDWPDAKAKLIMQNVRSAAGTSSKLVLFDTLALHTCGPSPLPAPEPLLPNLGIAASGFFTALDVEMLAMFNGKERTEADFRALGAETGWKLESVTPGRLATYVFSAV